MASQTLWAPITSFHGTTSVPWCDSTKTINFPSPLVLHFDGGLLILDNKQNKREKKNWVICCPACATAVRGGLRPIVAWSRRFLNAHLVFLVPRPSTIKCFYVSFALCSVWSREIYNPVFYCEAFEFSVFFSIFGLWFNLSVITFGRSSVLWLYILWIIDITVKNLNPKKAILYTLFVDKILFSWKFRCLYYTIFMCLCVCLEYKLNLMQT